MVLAASSIGGWCGRLEAALAEWRFVTSIDVLVGLGWLEPRRVDEWRQGRIPYLEAVVIASLGQGGRPERQRRPRDRVGDIAAVKPG